MDKTHDEFMEDVAVASSLPEQTVRALGPESDEDKSMYLNDGNCVEGEQDG